MVLILFLIDTSASMNQRTCLGTTYIDIAKGAVESFMKIRSRDQSSRGDRFMLVSFDEPPNCIKAGWRESPATFLEELKGLQAISLSGLGPALKESFNLLNLHRLQSGIDNYGMGRNPYYLEPAIIIAITDNGALCNTAGVLPELHLPMHNQLSGSELTKEPFRWDQRVFSLILQIPGTTSELNDNSPQCQLNPDDAPITAMCDVTGGRSYVITSQKILMQSLESIAQKIQPGVVIQFEKIGPDPEPINREGARTPGASTPKRENIVPSPDNMDVDQENKPVIGQIVNGVLPFFDVLKNSSDFQPIKSEGQETSSHSIQENPVRGDETPSLLQDQMLDPSNEESSLASSTSWHVTRRMIYVRSNPKVAVGHWPIPEGFWPDPGAQNMPPRDAHPNIQFSCATAEPMVIDNLPFDKYELEPSPLTQYILERKQPNSCWQTFVGGSGRDGGVSQPFGYLKASSNLQTVNLFVMPYNYPILLPLLDDLFKVHKCKPTGKWKESFDTYLQTMPNYYAGPLRNALRRMAAPNNLVPDHVDGSLSFSILTYLKKIKHQAKLEADRLINLVGKKPGRDAITRPFPHVPQLNEDKYYDYRKVILEKMYIRTGKKTQRSTLKTPSNIAINLEDRGLPFPKENVQTKSFKNPFDIPRAGLIEQLRRMRLNFFHSATASSKYDDEDQKHYVAVGQMGNYQEYLKMIAPLREVDPGQSRLHAFGNPFKLKQDHQLYAVDEADVNEAIAGPGTPPRKRQGENMYSNNKKRRKNETPPPSRRPQGPPNVPPSRPATPPIKAGNTRPAGTMKDIVNLSDILDDKIDLEEVKEIDKLDKIDKTERILENGLNADRKPLGKSMNRQLRKMQKMHKNKLSKAPKNNKSDLKPSGGEGPSPILSILRTSFANEETTRLQDTGEDIEVDVVSARRQEDTKKDEIPAKRRPTRPPLSAKKCRLLLQSYHNTKLRLKIWKDIRNLQHRVECYKSIEKTVHKVEGPREVKKLFLRDIIEEVEKFQVSSLSEKLKTLLLSLPGNT